MAKPRKYKVGDMFLNNHTVIWRITKIYKDDQQVWRYDMQYDMPDYQHLGFTTYKHSLDEGLKNKVFTRCTKAAKILFWKEPKSDKKKKRT